MAKYRDLIIEAKRLGITYAWRESGKTVFKPKKNLEQEIISRRHTAAQLVISQHQDAQFNPPLPSPVDNPQTPVDNPQTPVEKNKRSEWKTVVPFPADDQTPQTPPQKPAATGTLEQAILNLVGDNITARISTLETKLQQTLSQTATFRGLEIKSPAAIVKLPGLQHAQFDHVLRLASQRRNILLVGPAGTGKTHLAAQVAEALNLPFAFISASAGMSESALEGHLLPVGDNGRFDYSPSPFVNAYEQGGVFLIDEIDSADANLLTLINSALANGHMAIGKRLSNPIATRHPDFICIAAANTFGHGASRMYAGRQQLDAATLDRFRAGVVYIDYDERIEKAIVCPELLAWGQSIRAKITQHGLRRVMSTRFLRDYSVMMTAYPEHYNLETAKATYFSDWTADELGKV